MNEVLATGIWCQYCEFFEEANSIHLDNGRCMACGCDAERHVNAKVVPS